jgi:hypothetical protein
VLGTVFAERYSAVEKKYNAVIIILFEMGWDLVATFSIDQKEVPTDLNEEELVTWFISTKLNNEVPESVSVHYCYETFPVYSLHQFYSSYGTSFIRDDTRFDSIRYQRELLKQLDEETFPVCLADINYYTRTAEDAEEVAAALRAYFKHDSKLQLFADWLEFTSKHCDFYELSW